jgi:SAM-dependent methyltransferase
MSSRFARPAAPETIDVTALFYPEVGAGGFSRVDGTVAFYQRVNALLDPGMTVVDLGAGRGQSTEDPLAYRSDLAMLRGKVATVIGLDVDDAVLDNPKLDAAHLITVGARLPVDDGSVDLVVSDFTFEHIVDPAWAGRELTRILRPGGWICARTPNRWGYIGIPTRVVPNRLHHTVLRHAQPHKQERDTFPTAYRLNSKRQLRRVFPVDLFDHVGYASDSEPAYFGSSRIAWRAMQGVFAVTPPGLRSMLYVFLRKRETNR